MALNQQAIAEAKAALRKSINEQLNNLDADESLEVISDIQNHLTELEWDYEDKINQEEQGGEEE